MEEIRKTPTGTTNSLKKSRNGTKSTGARLTKEEICAILEAGYTYGAKKIELTGVSVEYFSKDEIPLPNPYLNTQKLVDQPGQKPDQAELTSFNTNLDDDATWADMLMSDPGGYEQAVYDRVFEPNNQDDLSAKAKNR